MSNIETRPKCCLTEAGLECSECDWHGCENNAESQEIDGGIDWVYICPRCSAWCAHTPLDEVKYSESIPCECAPV